MMSQFDVTRAMFHLPEGLIYLDGNSLGPLPLNAGTRIAERVNNEWGELLIRGWNKAGWLSEGTRIGDRIAKLIGAAAGTVIVGDTLSIKVYQALAAALALRPERKVILSDTGNFPSDLYMAQGLIDTIGNGHELRLVAPEDVAHAIDDSVAVLLLTQADYRTGRLHNMNLLTDLAHQAGALTIWDLAHTAGALDVDVTGARADFAVGCTYKYLNAGPGAPAFIYVAAQLQDIAKPALSGWLGHQAPFAFETSYRASSGIERFRIGTPPVLAMSGLDTALDVFDMVSIQDIRKQSMLLTDRFIQEVEMRCPDLQLMSPRDAAARGAQVSFAHEEGYAIMQALIANNVIGDFRAPNLIRFGFAPLYNGPEDAVNAAIILQKVMDERLWSKPEFRIRAAVT